MWDDKKRVENREGSLGYPGYQIDERIKVTIAHCSLISDQIMWEVDSRS
ncbi:hypothetical protein TNCV_3151611 [Trichonephila clavipes]|nr:hypothetical protein TNCV_3151611 [Trichonephila clavipes]